MARTRKRPWLAALLSFVQPGLGHVYLRSWLRTVLWFGLWAVTVLVVVPSPGSTAPTLDALARSVAALGDLSLEATLALASVTVFSTLDAYWLATRQNHYADPDVPRCPHCGQEVDADLDFCHWCTEPLSEAAGRPREAESSTR